ncbi:MAG TPA: serine/threonine-protein kinase [Candidatus Xenobia bacterium]
MKWFDAISKVFDKGKDRDNTTVQQDAPMSDNTMVKAPDSTVASDTMQPVSDQSMPVQPGEMVGGYRSVRLIAHGGMGSVFLAEKDGDPTPYALKTVSTPPGEDVQQILGRFNREVKIGQAINHPNVCRLIDFGQGFDLHYMVMEYLDGLTLKEYVAEQAPLANDLTLSVMWQVTSGLEAIHASGTIHRDLKPGNIVVLSDGTAKIMDFGISRMEGGTSLTKTGSALGTPNFISPEQIADSKRADARSDVFNLGLIAYNMLTGRLPFDAPRMALMLHRLVSGDATPIEENRPDVHPNLALWVTTCLKHDPVERFQTATDARLGLEAVAAAGL